MTHPVEIHSTDFWVKIVEMLQQNWALIAAVNGDTVCVHFISDTSGVFDEMEFPSADAAKRALERNGFRHFASSPDLQSFLHPPAAPFRRTAHPNGPIYSSGRFWRS